MIEQLERLERIEQREGRSQKDLKAQLIARAWQDPDFKRQLLANPKAAIEQELGIELPMDLEVTAVEETPARLYLVLPVNRTALSEEQLQGGAGGGVANCSTCTCGGNCTGASCWCW